MVYISLIINPIFSAYLVIFLPIIAHETKVGVKHKASHRSVTLCQESRIDASSSLKGKEKLTVAGEKSNLSLQKEDSQCSETTSRGENQMVSDQACTTSSSLKPAKIKRIGITKYCLKDGNLSSPALHLDHKSHISYSNEVTF